MIIEQIHLKHSYIYLYVCLFVCSFICLFVCFVSFCFHLFVFTWVEDAAQLTRPPTCPLTSIHIPSLLSPDSSNLSPSARKSAPTPSAPPHHSPNPVGSSPSPCTPASPNSWPQPVIFPIIEVAVTVASLSPTLKIDEPGHSETKVTYMGLLNISETFVQQKKT